MLVFARHFAAIALGSLALAPNASGALTLENASAPEGPGCRQVVIGVTTDAGRVRPLVPPAFLFSRDPAGKAQLGYRVQTCDRLSVDGAPPRRVSWTDLGVRILPPEGLPEVHVDPHVDGHDYYVLAFRSSDRVLAGRMRALGLRPPGSRRLLARETWMHLQRAPSPLGDASASIAADLVAGGALAAGERARQGAITLTAELLGGMVARTTPVVHVRQWFTDEHCRLIRGEETRTRTVGGLAAFSLHAEAGTLLAALAAPGGGAMRSQGADALIMSDTSATWLRAAVRPQPAAPAAYEVLQRASQGSPSGC